MMKHVPDLQTGNYGRIIATKPRKHEGGESGMTIATPEYITKGELDTVLKRITDKQQSGERMTEERFTSLEKLIDSKLTTIGLMMDKNLARHQATASEMKAEISDIRGDVKALTAQITALQSKMGWYITLLGVGVSVALAVFQMFVK